MKKTVTFALAAILLLTTLTSCRLPETHDYFGEAMEQNPDVELPKSEVMEVDPDTIPQYEIKDDYDGYDGQERIELAETDKYAAGELIVKYKIVNYDQNNAALVCVENYSDQPLTLYIDAVCEEINVTSRQISKKFEGFAANWSNYFVFDPGMPFDDFTFEIDYEIYDGKTYGQKIVDLGWSGIWLFPIPKYDGTGEDTGMQMGYQYDYIGNDWTGADMQFVLFEDDSMEEIILYYEQVYTGLGPVDERSGWYRSALYPAIGKLEGVKYKTVGATSDNSLGPCCGSFPAQDAYEATGFELPEPWRDCYGIVGFTHFWGPEGKPVKLPDGYDASKY